MKFQVISEDLSQIKLNDVSDKSNGFLAKSTAHLKCGAVQIIIYIMFKS